MLQYLIILLDDTSTSFCHYEVPQRESRLIDIDNLRKGIRFAMMENLMIQFVYPDYELPKEHGAAIEGIDHSKIKPSYGESETDVVVLNSWDLPTDGIDVPLVLRTTKAELFARYAELKNVLEITPRLNVVITDVESFTEEDYNSYKEVLEQLSEYVEQLYIKGKSPQLNLLTDRMMLKGMNNCGAGDTTITLAPNGKFYVCPAFYYEDEADSIGDLEHGLDIKNKQLYKLEYAPICRHCDAYQCKRCIWLNRKTTLEVNTPSHEQCVVAHLERNASRDLLINIRKHGSFLPEQEEIKELDYLDPFDKREEW
ncbi:MAG: CXXX repeat peptide maturase [Prevotella sp.]|nr:CXXX repeat peptide maturase [Prevotella sp.]